VGGIAQSGDKCWQVQHVIQPSGASREEIKVQKEVFAVAVDTTDRLDRVLEKLELSKTINFCTWILFPAQFSPS